MVAVRKARGLEKREPDFLRLGLRRVGQVLQPLRRRFRHHAQPRQDAFRHGRSAIARHDDVQQRVRPLPDDDRPEVRVGLLQFARGRVGHRHAGPPSHVHAGGLEGLQHDGQFLEVHLEPHAENFDACVPRPLRLQHGGQFGLAHAQDVHLGRRADGVSVQRRRGREVLRRDGAPARENQNPFRIYFHHACIILKKTARREDGRSFADAPRAPQNSSAAYILARNSS